jgi:hypothetical protein
MGRFVAHAGFLRKLGAEVTHFFFLGEKRSLKESGKGFQSVGS